MVKEEIESKRSEFPQCGTNSERYQCRRHPFGKIKTPPTRQRTAGKKMVGMWN